MMKKLFISIGLGLLTIVLVAFGQSGKLQAVSNQDPLNPYDQENLSVDKIIEMYHQNANNNFNRYIAMLDTGVLENADGKVIAPDENGQPVIDKKNMTVMDCYQHPENYSTFCVSVNMLGVDSSRCNGQKDQPEACTKLDKNSQVWRGFMNFRAALNKKKPLLTETPQNQQGSVGKSNATLGSSVVSGLDSMTALRTIILRKTNIDDEVLKAKNALDQTLAAYDQLQIAWPLHQNYLKIYKDLVQYRDKLVDLRQETDQLPLKFIDTSTTQCK